MIYWIVRSLTVVVFKVLFRLQAFGQKNIPLQGGFILASNHTSYLDPPILGAASPRVLSFLAKEGLFKNAIFGRFIAVLNTFPIKTRHGDVKALRWGIRKLKAGGALAIFPEGGRTADGKLDEPMQGVGFLAAKSGASIVPAFIEGSHRALPIDSKLIRLKKIKVYFGSPIMPERINTHLTKKDSYHKIALRTMEEIKRLKNNIRKR